MATRLTRIDYVRSRIDGCSEKPDEASFCSRLFARQLMLNTFRVCSCETAKLTRVRRRFWMRVLVPWLGAYQCWSCQSVFLVSQPSMLKIQIRREEALLRAFHQSKAVLRTSGREPAQVQADLRIDARMEATEG